MPLSPSDYAPPSLTDTPEADAPDTAAPQPSGAPPDLKKLVAFAAGHFDVDPNVLAGMVMKESMLQDDVVSGKRKSSAGAVGIAQLMPDTARRYGVDPTDPAQSIIGMAAYLRDNLVKFNGDYRKAIAGYNWGENRRALTDGDWERQAPVETRDYVDFVTKFADSLRGTASESAARRALPPGVQPGAGGAGRGSVNPALVDPNSPMPSMTQPGLASEIGLGALESFGEGSGTTARGMGRFVQAPLESVHSSSKNLLAAALAAADGVNGSEIPVDALGNPTGAAAPPLSDEQARLSHNVALESRADARGAADAAELARQRARKEGSVLGIVGGAMEDAGKGAQDYYAKKLQQDAPRMLQQQQDINNAHGFVDTLKQSALNPLGTLGTVAQSIPDTAVGAGVGSVAGKVAQVALERSAIAAGERAFQQALIDAGSKPGGLANATTIARAARADAYRSVMEHGTEKAAGVVGNYVEGSQSGASTGLQVADFVQQRNQDGSYNLSDADLAKNSPRFRDLIASGQPPLQARALLAAELADEASPIAALWTRAAGRVSGAAEAEGKLLANGQISGRVALQNIAKEGLEEGLQNPGEDYAAYDSKRQVDPTQTYDLGGSIAQGVVGGIAQAGPMHGAGYLQSRMSAPAPRGATNFTEPDSASAKAGLTPIIVPNAAPAAQNVAPEEEQPHAGVSDALAALAAARSARGGNLAAGGLGADGDVAAGEAGRVPDVPTAPAGRSQSSEPAGASGGEAAGAAPVVGAGEAQGTQGSLSPDDHNADAPVATWRGRSGDGYATEKDAQQAIPGREQRHPDLEWRVERDAQDGRLNLVGYKRPDSAPRSFARDTGTLGVPRSEMPQIRSEHHGALVNFLNARGVEHTSEEVDPNTLKPTQAEYVPAKVQQAEENQGGRSVLISSDNHVLDGHHQWLADKAAGRPTRVIRLDSPMKQLLVQAKEFPSSTTQETNDGAVNDTASGNAGTALAGQAGEDAGVRSGGELRPAAGGPGDTLAGNAVPGAAAAGPEGLTEGESNGAAGSLDLRGSTADAVGTAAAGSESSVADPAPEVVDAAFRRIENARLKLGEAVKLERAPAGQSVDTDTSVKLARVFGAPIVFARAKSGRGNFSAVNSNGLIIVMSKAQDAHVALTMHEVVHGMDEDLKKALITALQPYMNRDAFLSDFPNYPAHKVDEEIVARLAQQHAKTPEFWNDLRAKMGDGPFSKLADHILAKLKEIVGKFRGNDLKRYATDIEQVRDALTTAYAEHARRQGGEQAGGTNFAENVRRSSREIVEDPNRFKQDYGLQPKTNGVREIGEALNKRTADRFGTIADTDTSVKARDEIAVAIADEVEHQLLGDSRKNKSGVGWYSHNYPKALRALGRIYPELQRSKGARATFTAFLAVTSNGEKVGRNIAMARQLYETHRTGGDITKAIPGTKRQEALDKNVTEIARLLDKYGENGLPKFLLEEMRVGDINAQLRKAGEDTSTSYPANMIMPRAAMYFGPKLGAFYANLMGSSGYLTMDLWWSRSVNRMRGTLVPQVSDVTLNNMREAFGEPDATQERLVELAKPYEEAYAAKNYKDGTTLEKKSNSFIKKAVYELNEAPARASDREFMVAAAQKAQALLKARGVDITLADMQAALWYYEKRLYGALGSKVVGDIGYQEALENAARETQPAGDAGSQRPAARNAGQAVRPAAGRDVPVEGAAPDFSEDDGGSLARRLRLDGGVRGGAESVAVDSRPKPGTRGTSLSGLAADVKVDGEVVHFGAFKPAQDAARAYADKAGIDYNPPRNYVKVDQARATRIADAFEAMKHDPADPEVKAAYAQMIKETLAQYQAILDTGLKVEFITGDDPYGNPRNAILDVTMNNHLWVFPTTDGFGGPASAEVSVDANPLLAETQYAISGRVALANDIFRVVHDYFGHIKEGVGFRADGEENAWRAHSAMYSPLARRAMTSETRGQNSWVNYGPHAQANKTASPTATEYAPQKTGLLPEWVSEDGVTDFSENGQAQGDMFASDMATKRTTVQTRRLISSSGETERGGNVDSAGRRITATKQGLQNFWNWFGSSEATDESGRPLVLYHSTNANIAALEAGRKSSNNYGLLGDVEVARSGIFATPDREFSQEYLRNGVGQNVMPLYMKLENPLDLRSGLSESDERALEEAGLSTRYVTNVQNYWELFDNDDHGKNEFVDGLRRAGYDGAIFRESSPGGQSSGGVTYVALQPSQLKSALGNRGTFDAGDGRINFSEDESAKNTLDQLAKTDSFVLPKSDHTDFRKLTAELMPGTEIKDRVDLDPGEWMWSLKMPSGQYAYVTIRDPIKGGPKAIFANVYDPARRQYNPTYDRPGSNAEAVAGKGDVWVDVSNLDPGLNGQEVYNLAMSYAHNTGRVFIGDPSGVSDHAMRRRPEQMLSSALKFGTTEHLAPHPDQIAGRPDQGIPGMDWRYGDHVGNITKLIDQVLALEQNLPTAAKVDAYDYDPASNRYTDRRSGETFTADGLAARKAGAQAGTDARGHTTMARRAVLRALAGEAGGVRGDVRRGDRTLARLLELARDRSAGRIFYAENQADVRGVASDVSPIGFYRELDRRIQGGPGKAMPDQWRAYIKGLTTKGVKADEIAWSGIEDWLKLQTGKVTKEQVGEFLKNNGVRVTETQLGANSALSSAERQEVRELNDLYRRSEEGEDGVFDAGDFDRLQELEAKGDGATVSKFDDYTLPGGTNYREVLLTLPEKRGAVISYDDWITKNFTANDLPPSRFLRSTYEAALKDGGAYESAKPYRSSHWDEPNVLAHIRVNDRTDAEGKRVLFVEELQSDWGQEGKKKGFAEPKHTTINALNGTVTEHPSEAAARAAVAAGGEGTALQYRRTAPSGPAPAPFVGKTDAWLNLALKRVIKMAVDEGYDKVAFVNGEQSAERYDLSKQVERIDAMSDAAKTGERFYNIDVSTKTGQDFNRDGLSEQDLEDAVGKQMAQKIVGATTETGKRVRFANLDLKVGGEGMKAFYDQIVPNAVKDVVRKLGGDGLVGVKLRTDGYFNGQFAMEIPDRTAALRWAAAEGGRELRAGGPEQTGFVITDKMRQTAGAGLPMFSDNPVEPDYAFDLNSIKKPTAPAAPVTNATDGWILSRDELGNFRFGAGAKVYRAVADVAQKVLAKIGLAPMSKELARAVRVMKQEVANSMELTAKVANEMKKMPEHERQLISDIIEGELQAGVTPAKHVLDIAANISALMSQQTDDLVAVGMLSKDAADKWRDKYLPRFYESKLRDNIKDSWEKAVARMSSKPKALRGIGGKSLKRRGLVEVIDPKELKAYQDMGWAIDDPGYKPGISQTVAVHRDFTREERDRMGEIRDAMFRFVMGYSRSQKDLALGRLYEHLADTMASRHELEGYVRVPDSRIDGTDVNTYGKLAGLFVPQEVLSHLSQYGESEHEALLKIYRKGMGMWKEGKTVLNPVSHANNIVSNVTMAHFGGVSYWDVHKYAATINDFVRGTDMLKEAKAAGLFGGTISETELMNLLPKEMQVMAQMTQSKTAKAVEGVWNTMSLFLRKPLGAAYQAEDLFFRHMLYREARSRGLHENDAVDYAQKFIFTYDDLPKGARLLRDFALPFFSYTYKVIPVMAETAMSTPWRYAAPMAVIHLANAVAYAIATGHDDDDDWKESIKRFVLDREFREKAKAKEAMERQNLPSWMQGNGFALQTPKTIRLGADDLTQLPVFMDVSRMFPGGDLLDMTSNTGGIPWLQNLTPSHPILSTMTAMMFNRDPYFGKDVVDANDTNAEAAVKRGQWLWTQVAPAIAVGNYHFNRAANAVAQATGHQIPWWPDDYTGFGKDGLPVQPQYAAMQTIGIKARPIDLDTAAQIAAGQRKKMINDIETEMRGIRRLRSKGAVSGEQAEKKLELDRTKIQRLRQGQTVDGDTPE